MVTVLIIGFVVLSLVIIWLVPKWQIKSKKKKFIIDVTALELKDRLNFEKEFITVENSFRLTILQIIGGLVVIIGIYFSVENLSNTQRAIVISQEGQITDRFYKAVNQLGDSNIDLNIGGIYSLSRIAKDSEKDYWPIMEILTAYVRRKSPRDQTFIKNKEFTYSTKIPGTPYKFKRPSSDIQAITQVIRERNYTLENENYQVIRLDITFLQGAYFKNTHLKNATFISSDLTGAIFDNSDLDSCFISYSVVHGASFKNTSLKNAQLAQTDFSFSNLDNAHLEGANLSNSNLAGTVFSKIFFKDAILDGTNLEYLDLRNAIGLTKSQISKAIINKETILPNNIK